MATPMSSNTGGSNEKLSNSNHRSKFISTTLVKDSKILDHDKVMASLNKTQNLLDLFADKHHKRSQSSVIIDELLQPILRQHKTKPMVIGVAPQDPMPANEYSAFKAKGCSYSPLSAGNHNSLVRELSNKKESSASKSVSSGSKPPSRFH